MLKVGMYVRCSIDREDSVNPRKFAMGQIKEIDSFADVAKISFKDPFGFRMFYEDVPDGVIIPISKLTRCSAYKNSYVIYNIEKYKIMECEVVEEWNYYYIQNEKSKKIIKVSEEELSIPFTNGHISPVEQLKNYEFQNPCWYFGRNIVSKTMNILENSIYGFRELAGCKIFLMPHQLKTIMRCLQNEQCRFMLADEVGMGKTIEAISIIKIYLSQNAGKNVLIAVPPQLYEQWKTELFFKFGLSLGKDKLNNKIVLKSTDEIGILEMYTTWDFVIVDEVHRLLHDLITYEKFHRLSKTADNVLLLSATPVQQKEEEYLSLLRLVMPDKYDSIDLPAFKQLVEKQKSITKAAYMVLMDFEDYQEQMVEVLNEENDPKEDEDCQDLFEEVEDRITKLVKIVDDNILDLMAENVVFDSEDYGVEAIQEVMAYVCDNYQIERNIIRNRRKYIEDELPKRTVETIPYMLDPDKNTYEYATYESITSWIETEHIDADDFKTYFMPLLNAYFSSPWAFLQEINNIEKKGFHINDAVKQRAEQWKRAEEAIILDFDNAMQDPELYTSRIIHVLDYLSEEAYKEKVVIFTNQEETFKVYRKVLEEHLGKEKISVFNKYMDKDTLEVNVYKFQNDIDCKIMLCDETGGEGRNFQDADIILHIDLPWDANTIEQRIGRLDRLGRAVEKDVKSVVLYIENTLEEELFNFWDKGLNIFEHSLSGLEIMMNDINNSLIGAITKDFRYGIADTITTIIDFSKTMETEIREEQHFDTAAYTYAAINQKLNKLVREYTCNENELFSSTMLGWCSLAGLKPEHIKENCISFNERSFSTRSAENSLLIPPNWTSYMEKEENKFVSKVQELYQQEKRNSCIGARSIQGTFDRETAIVNDYLHFFAPGDDVFDCIVDNAIRSSKGQIAAFALKGNVDWKGLVFTFSVEPNELLLLENNVPLVTLSQYRSYLASNQLQVLIPLPNYIDVSEKIVCDELKKMSALPLTEQKKALVHLGKRSMETDFLRISKRFKTSNITWFKNSFSEEKWVSFVEKSTTMAKKRAWDEFKKRSDINGANQEMKRVLGSMKASEKYYGLDSKEYEQTRQQFKIIINALNSPKIKIESTAFLWMVKE